MHCQQVWTSHMFIIFTFVLLSAFLCKLPIENQSQRLRQSCQSKLTGYFWDGQQCLRCKSPKCVCSTYDGCQSCLDSYYFDKFTQNCKRCPYGCLSCCQLLALTDIVCSNCISGFKNLNGVCVKIDGCLYYNQYGRCEVCDAGNYFENSCVECPAGCQTCNSLQVCTSCLEGYYLEIEDKEQLCYKCKIANCATCDGNGCEKCMEGFFQSGSTCASCPINCLKCDGTSCLLCREDYFENSKGQCQACHEMIPNCMECEKIEDEFACKYCLNGYYKGEGKCLSCREVGKNNRRCDSPEMITQCDPGFLLLPTEYDSAALQIHFLLRYECVENVYGCKKVNDTKGSCVECLPGEDFILKDGYQACQACNVSSPKCKDCNYDPIKNQQVCIVCQDFYYPDAKGSCQQCQSNCVTCDQELCYQCEEGFFLKEKACVSCGVEKCSECLEVGNCQKCHDGYGFVNEKCEACQVGCKICNFNQAFCSVCDEGYYLYIGSCIKLPTNCIEANEYGFCYQCKTQINYDETQDKFVDESEETLMSEDEPSYFYKSVNGYCLLCNDYDSGSFFCPWECPVQHINSKFMIRTLLVTFLFVF